MAETAHLCEVVGGGGFVPLLRFEIRDSRNRLLFTGVYCKNVRMLEK